MDFSKRSPQPEWLDAGNLPAADIQRNMQELEIINRYLGGHRITIAGFRSLIPPLSSVAVCELGCGGGDNLMAIQHWCSRNNTDATFSGVDINPDCIAVALTKNWLYRPILMTADYRDAIPAGIRQDILFSSLFCHHFSQEELVGMLQWMQSKSKLGFFINDLHRHPLAYYSIKWLTRLFSRSYLVKHDAPLSVLRGFKRKDWTHILQSAGITRYRIQWKWAFRWLIVVYH
jgi:2-polyprenyl-3-methyl-5-hydroxy-6-metoxy-1,4-benzoquinol methylase